MAQVVSTHGGGFHVTVTVSNTVRGSGSSSGGLSRREIRKVIIPELVRALDGNTGGLKVAIDKKVSVKR